MIIIFEKSRSIIIKINFLLQYQLPCSISVSFYCTVIKQFRKEIVTIVCLMKLVHCPSDFSI